MLEATDAGLIGIRDRALILLGFAGAFRRGVPDHGDEDVSPNGFAEGRVGAAGVGTNKNKGGVA